jgi:hypothetical protein
MKSAVIIVVGALSAAICAQQSPAAAKPQWLNGLSDLSVFLKPRFSSPSTWDQQFGLRARIVRYGNFSSEYSFAYDPNYPIKLDIKPKWTTGVQFAYFFTHAPFPIGVYTTPKYSLVNSWKEELGLNARFLNTPRIYVNSAIDYQASYPFLKESKPVFQASLTVGFPFGG